MSDLKLLVAGVGGGLAGALRAAEFGHSVLAVEAKKHYRRGNNTSMSATLIPSADSRRKRARGIQDSPESYLADIMHNAGVNLAVLIARASSRVSAELVDQIAVPIALFTNFAYSAHRAPRLLPERHGVVMLPRYLMTAAKADANVEFVAPGRPVDVYPSTGVRSQGSSGEFVAVLQRPGGSQEQTTVGAVLLATGGYGADPTLAARRIPEIAAAIYHRRKYSKGDELRISAQDGAATVYYDAYQGHAGISDAAQALLNWITVMNGAIVITMDGLRSRDEAAGYSEYAAALAAQPGSDGWLVLDARSRGATLSCADYRNVVDSGAVRPASFVVLLATEIGVPAHSLRTELDEATAATYGASPADRAAASGLSTCWMRRVRRLRLSMRTPRAALRSILTPECLCRRVAHSRLERGGRRRGGDFRHRASAYLADNGLLLALGLSYLAANYIAGLSGTRGASADDATGRPAIHAQEPDDDTLTSEFPVQRKGSE